MTEARMELVRGVFQASGTAEMETLLAQLDQIVPATCTEDVEFVEMPDRVDSRTYHGHEGVKQAFRRYFEQWGAWEGELTGLEDHDDRVFASMREQASGQASGVEVEKTLYMVFSFRGDKICRYFESYDEATARRELPGSP